MKFITIPSFLYMCLGIIIALQFLNYFCKCFVNQCMENYLSLFHQKYLVNLKLDVSWLSDRICDPPNSTSSRRYFRITCFHNLIESEKDLFLWDKWRRNANGIRKIVGRLVKLNFHGSSWHYYFHFSNLTTRTKKRFFFISLSSFSTKLSRLSWSTLDLHVFI